MENFDYFNKNTLNDFLVLRNRETKLGENVQFINTNEDDVISFLNNTTAKYIIFGINEFVGVKANFGKAGEKYPWNIFLFTFLNIQHNKFLKGYDIALLGAFNYDKYNAESAILNPNNPLELERLREIVSEIDKDVTYLNALIHKAGKKAIVIGGGHNNAYGNIKGLALANASKVNVVNFDAHTDFRPLEGRHSGNGFSYTFKEEFIDQYFVFGAHENYLNKYMLNKFKEFNNRLHLVTFEELKVRMQTDFFNSINAIAKNIKSLPYGIEVDVDAIENVASSAMSPSGFNVNEARKFVSRMASNKNASYLHICEGSPSLSNNSEVMIGKLITYLVTDFIKAQNSL